MLAHLTGAKGKESGIADFLPRHYLIVERSHITSLTLFKKKCPGVLHLAVCWPCFSKCPLDTLLNSLRAPSCSLENKIVALSEGCEKRRKHSLSSRAAAVCWPILYLMMILLQLCASSLFQLSSRFTYLK